MSHVEKEDVLAQDLPEANSGEHRPRAMRVGVNAKCTGERQREIGGVDAFAPVRLCSMVPEQLLVL